MTITAIKKFLIYIMFINKEFSIITLIHVFDWWQHTYAHFSKESLHLCDFLKFTFVRIFLQVRVTIVHVTFY